MSLNEVSASQSEHQNKLVTLGEVAASRSEEATQSKDSEIVSASETVPSIPVESPIEELIHFSIA